MWRRVYSIVLFSLHSFVVNPVTTDNKRVYSTAEDVAAAINTPPHYVPFCLNLPAINHNSNTYIAAMSQ
jgi:hypothetical protein